MIIAAFYLLHQRIFRMNPIYVGNFSTCTCVPSKISQPISGRNSGVFAIDFLLVVDHQLVVDFLLAICHQLVVVFLQVSAAVGIQQICEVLDLTDKLFSDIGIPDSFPLVAKFQHGCFGDNIILLLNGFVF